ncbi:hypothetical protein TELCIR_09363 [Teladorsagia circumcincta]|uniref:Uncharacterized protein n=1 Tax=Teladorsagia circumcincta TaxID=45464 RepID=A0A2G9UF74_TELCI|nr:hypothetical protein TELCIR_09363 [Teladorsagia circumcincta]
MKTHFYSADIEKENARAVRRHRHGEYTSITDSISIQRDDRNRKQRRSMSTEHQESGPQSEDEAESHGEAEPSTRQRRSIDRRVMDEDNHSGVIEEEELADCELTDVLTDGEAQETDDDRVGGPIHSMSKVTPADMACDVSVTGSRVGFLITMAVKANRMTELPIQRHPTQLPPVYQQSSTRRLAFGSTPYDTSHPQKDFYNNNTLVNLSKLFCVAVLLTAFLLVMTRGFSYFNSHETNSTSTALFFL